MPNQKWWWAQVVLSFKPEDFSAWLKGLGAKIELGRLLGQDQGIQVKNSDELEPEDFKLCPDPTDIWAAQKISSYFHNITLEVHFVIFCIAKIS